MAGLKGRSGPPGNQNAFQHGLRSLQTHRMNGALGPAEQNIREEILAGLVADKGGEQQIGTATRVLAEVVASDAAWLTAFNKAIDYVVENNRKARQNPKALATLDGYKRGLVNSLTANLARFGFDRITKVKSLQEIIDSMPDETTENPAQESPGTLQTNENDG